MMRLLDLYCGGGGAAVGYSRAGFDEIVGVDINPQGNYPFTFVQGDALAFLRHRGRGFGGGLLIEDFDAIHASPPCQAYTRKATDAIHASPPCQAYTRKATDWGRKRTHWLDHPDLLGPTREALLSLGLPFVIENVPGAPIRHDLMLCGTMFGLTIRKHRYFESSIPLVAPRQGCTDHAECYNPWQGRGRSAAKLRVAMGIGWLPISGGASRKNGYTGDLFNAIPPAYTEFVGRQLIAATAAEGDAR